MNRTATSPLHFLGSLDRFLSQSLQSPGQQNHAHRIFKSDQGVRLEIDLPGFDKSDLKIQRESRKLTISSIESSEHEFAREFNLGADYDLEKINASLNNGLLQIDIPKTEEVTATQEIEIH